MALSGETYSCQAPANVNTHWVTNHRQFEATAHANQWSEEEKKALLLKGLAMELLQKVPVDNLKSSGELIKILELKCDYQHLRNTYDTHLKATLQWSVECFQELEADVDRLAFLKCQKISDVQIFIDCQRQ